ncbi:MAG: ligase [Chloroflexia bacterium]|nr:ligase [Chloroflexia bacterium]
MTLHEWRVLPYQATDVASELAASDSLLAGLVEVAQPVVRWYGAPGEALVLGSGQRLSEIDREAARHIGVTVHRRGSGGGAVLFTPGFLMQDIALPPTAPLYRTDVTEAYRWLGEVWGATLGHLGLATTLVSVAEARADAHSLDELVQRACFGGRSPYELLADGRKLVGFSQIRRRPGALFQVGLYRHWPGAELVRLLGLPTANQTHLVARLAERVVGLDELLTPVPDKRTIMDAFAHALAERYEIKLVGDTWRSDERQGAAQASGRYLPL